MTTVDLVCVNYRTPGDLARFCHSLTSYAPTQHQWTITLVNVSPRQEDEAVAHDMLDQLDRAGADFSKLVTYEANVGYATSCNYAARMAGGEFIAFFNADVALTPNAIDLCVAAMEGHPDWGVLGPRQVDDRGRMTHAGIFGTHTRPALRGWMFSDDPQFGGVHEAISVSGAAYFVRREMWEQLTECPLYQQAAPGATGAFLPTPFFYEETFCSYHAATHGWRVVYYGKVGIVHNWNGSVKANHSEKWAVQQMSDSQLLFREACDHHGIVHD